ncbi:MAG: endonuclease III domain-containing protein [Elusimicrobiota bacterium]
MNKKFQQLYKILFKTFGRRGWWPVTPAPGREPVYRPGFYKKPLENESFEICLGAILTQNTSWENVKKCLIELSGKKLISPEKILRMSLPGLEKLIRSSGYYRQKAIKIHAFCSWWSGAVEKRDKMNDLDLRNSLLEVKGIGPETADSMLLYSFARTSFVIDAYTRRIIARMKGVNEQEYEELKSEFENALEKKLEIYNEYHALLVELGKRFCLKRNPLCGDCPAISICIYGRKNELKRKNYRIA